MSIRVVEYIRADRSNPYQRWFESLDRQAAAKIAMARARLELGHQADIEQARALHDEYKARKKG
jgi:putative component of toxin-antitoxin plasmid stabilization module